MASRAEAPRADAGRRDRPPPLRVCFLEKPKLDVAVPSLEVPLVRAFEGHGIERYERFGGRARFSEAQCSCYRAALCDKLLGPETKVGPPRDEAKRKRESILVPHWDLPLLARRQPARSKCL